MTNRLYHCLQRNTQHGIVSKFPHLNSEVGGALLHETVDLVKSYPEVVVSCR